MFSFRVYFKFSIKKYISKITILSFLFDFLLLNKYVFKHIFVIFEITNLIWRYMSVWLFKWLSITIFFNQIIRIKRISFKDYALIRQFVWFMKKLRLGFTWCTKDHFTSTVFSLFMTVPRLSSDLKAFQILLFSSI